MKAKTSELTGSALDYAVAKCEGMAKFSPFVSSKYYFAPSKSWQQGGPIIEREGISIKHLFITDDLFRWYAKQKPTIKNVKPDGLYGPTLLITAMRCYVASKIGEEVEIPEEMIYL